MVSLDRSDRSPLVLSDTFSACQTLHLSRLARFIPVSDLRKLARYWQQCWPDPVVSSGDRQEFDSPQQTLRERVFQSIVAAYTQPARYYHNLNHIEHFLTILDRFTNPTIDRSLPVLQDPISVSLAAWFHDFIYDSQASDNERQSANAAKELLTNIDVTNDSSPRQIAQKIDRIQQLILATSSHQIAPNDPDMCIFLDADLAILGTDPVIYQAYSRAIRCEYSWVSDADYRVGRIRVLESFLERDRLYYTDILFDELESIARLNLKTEFTEIQ
jgi:predicted metal-dependent HD superfamily phosphohydrolase